MPNITIQVSDELYQHARLAAARRNMSVSAMIRALLLTTQNDPAQQFLQARPSTTFSGPGVNSASQWKPKDWPWNSTAGTFST
ncbi:CopG family transcriptional regulator [Terracidiphilus gabretensis]|uniref:CopG family transcriptional regulator n=1 Tax=Terracidiphilus gabretensis TaxID=1577687 RepID=UPI00071BD80A|nr:CopG family transcriptional regulator [Terracidiphilus gabretensis]